MSGYDYQLTEEIARWAFEVVIRSDTNWDIAFTNPTAGPWKRVMATDANGARGEVYRFPRDDDRPDLILVSDKLKTVLILEAKDSLPKLLVDEQRMKSVEVIGSLARILGSLRKNKYWGTRCDYDITAGVLWGGDSKSSDRIVGECVKQYGRELKKLGAVVSSDFLAIEVVRTAQDGSLTCNAMMYQRRADDYVQKDGDVVNSLVPGLRK